MDRIERLRQQDLSDLVDRAIPEIAAGTPRQLVRVYNGGSMPSMPDHFYLTNPVYLNGAPTEGGAGAPSVDTSQTIVVDVLNQAPMAGDFLTAYAVGGRWVAELTSSQSPKTGCIQFLGCNSLPLPGVVLKIYDHQGGALLAGPLTSDANGRICPGLPAGLYWMDPTNGGDYNFPLNRYNWAAQTFGVPSGGVVFWPVTLEPGYACCTTVLFPLPTTLFLTVCGQTFTLAAAIFNNTQILGWAPDGGTAEITTDDVAAGNLCACNCWDGVTTGTEAVLWAVRLLCPPGTTGMTGLAGVCGIGHFNGQIGGFDTYAICPPGCEGVGFGTCCNGGAAPDPGVPFALIGTIGETINLSGKMPGAMSTSCVLPPAAPWPLPCAGQEITVTN
jgi:hypothetical protein